MIVPDQETAPAVPAEDVDELTALIAAGGFWRLAPEWVPRTGYTKPTHNLLRAVEAGLKGRLQVNADYPEHGEPPIRSALLWPSCNCGHPECPNVADAPPKYEGPDDRSVSPAMQRLRPGVERENQRARGGWGR